MATNTLIQKLFAVDEIGVGESDNGVSNRRQIETYRATAAIAAGDAVAFDLTQTSNGLRAMCIKPANTGTTGSEIAIGVAESAIAVDAFGDVVLKGIVEEAKTKGDVVNIAVGDVLAATGADGKLHAYAVDEGGAATFNLASYTAIALEAQTGDSTSRVLVCSPVRG